MTEPTDAVFEVAVAILLQHEGGYVNDAHDPGGETKFGISRRSYPTEDIEGLTVDRAKAIYQRDWWNRYGLWRLPPRIGAKMLDLGVNMGMATAAKCLQRALVSCGENVEPDGILGPATFQACGGVNAAFLLEALRDQAADHYRAIVAAHPSLARFEGGWLARASA